jgi:hypothetical protein
LLEPDTPQLLKINHKANTRLLSEYTEKVDKLDPMAIKYFKTVYKSPMEEALEEKNKKIDHEVLRTIGKREVLIKKYGLTAAMESEEHSEDAKLRKPMMMITENVQADI